MNFGATHVVGPDVKAMSLGMLVAQGSGGSVEFVDGESGGLGFADSMRRGLGNDPEELGRCDLRGLSGSKARFLQSRDGATLVGQRPRGTWILRFLVRWRVGGNALEPEERGVPFLVSQRLEINVIDDS